jgi:hypothetical protein
MIQYDVIASVGAPLVAKYSPDGRFIFVLAQAIYKSARSLLPASNSTTTSNTGVHSSSVSSSSSSSMSPGHPSTRSDNEEKDMDSDEDVDDNDNDDSKPIATDDISAINSTRADMPSSSQLADHLAPFTAEGKVDFRTDLISYGYVVSHFHFPSFTYPCCMPISLSPTVHDIVSLMWMKY